MKNFCVPLGEFPSRMRFVFRDKMLILIHFRALRIAKTSTYLEFPVLPLRGHAPHVTLDLDDRPQLPVVVAPHEVTPAPRLQPHDVTPQVPELVAEHARPDQGLEPHVAGAHLAVLLLAVVGAEVLLDDDGGGAHLEEAAAVVPAANAALEDEDLLGEDAVALLLEEEVLRVLQEDLRAAQLVVGLAEDVLANLGRGAAAVVLKRSKTPREF